MKNLNGFNNQLVRDYRRLKYISNAGSDLFEIPESLQEEFDELFETVMIRLFSMADEFSPESGLKEMVYELCAMLGKRYTQKYLSEEIKEDLTEILMSLLEDSSNSGPGGLLDFPWPL